MSLLPCLKNSGFMSRQADTLAHVDFASIERIRFCNPSWRIDSRKIVTESVIGDESALNRQACGLAARACVHPRG
jgi:hypothetical protein